MVPSSIKYLFKDTLNSSSITEISSSYRMTEYNIRLGEKYKNTNIRTRKIYPYLRWLKRVFIAM